MRSLGFYGRRFIAVSFAISFAAALNPSQAQLFAPADTLNKPKLTAFAVVTSAGYTGTIIGLNELWYKDYPRSDFHFFNDNGSWLQMDKMGHALTAYQVGRLGYESMRWTGASERSSIWIGGNIGLVFLTSVELLDGFSEEWGFSYGDMVANVSGTALFTAQQLVWKEQRLALKFSYSASDYAKYRPETLGAGGLESLFKDYNGQTIWLSINPSSFFHRQQKFLPWLSLSLGYSGNGMLGGDFNPIVNSEGIQLPIIEPYRQYFLSFDIDLQRIPTKSHFLKSVFSVVGFIKVPAPTVGFSQNSVRWHWIYF